MYANSSNSARGFTVTELVAVIVLGGILAAVAAPKLVSVMSFRTNAWRDQVVATLHQAHKSAISHRRLVCATISANAVTLSIASTNPATACNVPLAGVDGKVQAAVNSGTAATTLNPAGLVFFQPSGRVTTDGAGTNSSLRTIAIGGVNNIVLVGETGHVE